MMSLGLDIPIGSRICLHIAGRGYSEDAAGNGAKKTLITLFFTTRKRIVLDVLPKGHKYNQQYFVDYIFPDLKTGDLSFRRGMPESAFWVHMDNSMCYNGSKLMSKCEKRHVSGFPHARYSLDISPTDFWLFGILKGILNDHEFNSSDEIEEAITRIWDALIFDNVQRPFQKWMNRLGWVIENGGKHAPE
jgi:hypothetical protein